MSFKLLKSSLTLSYLATISARSWASLIAASCSASAPVEELKSCCSDFLPCEKRTAAKYLENQLKGDYFSGEMPKPWCQSKI